MPVITHKVTVEWGSGISLSRLINRTFSFPVARSKLLPPPETAEVVNL